MAEPCFSCQIVYGMENPRNKELASSRHFLIVIDNENTSQLFIIPLKPVADIDALIDSNPEIAKEVKALTEKMAGYIADNFPVSTSCDIKRCSTFCGRGKLGMHQYITIIIL